MPGDLFGGGTGFYLLGASLVQPLFRGGELQARRRSAVAAYEQAGAAYQEAVLQGFQNVADVLRALEADAARLRERADAAERARRYRDITAERLTGGRRQRGRHARSDASPTIARCSSRRRQTPIAMPTLRRCCRRSAAAGGRSLSSRAKSRFRPFVTVR